ncbi:MAG: PA domain-containing protein [Trueperaceae bacterium]
MKRDWLGFSVVLVLLLALLSACSGGADTPEETIEMTLSSPGVTGELQAAAALTTTTSALQVLGLVNPPGVTVTYTVNGGEAQPVTVIDGGFTFLATLAAGDNTIAVTASLNIRPSIKVTKTVVVNYQPVVSSGLTYGGTLSADGPTFTRPDQGEGLSDADRTNPYSAYTFNIDTKDWYQVLSTQLFDGYLLLYKDSFDPLSPLTNLITVNDDFQNIDANTRTSRVRAELEPGQYVAVTTACGNPAAGCGPNLGDFSNLISRTDPPPPPFQLPPADDSKFNITVRFLTNNVTAEQQQAFVDAANRWAEIITGDLGNVELAEPVELDAGAASVVGTIDDILIDAKFTDIDGPSNILGGASPRVLRPADSPDANLPIYSYMEFDLAEFAPGGFFDDPKRYKDVILHEMGHALGFTDDVWQLSGNLLADWNPNPPLDVNLGTFNPNYDPRFIGENANKEYRTFLQKAGKTDEDGVPLENTGLGGNINSHWRELTFDNELMSPTATGVEALSRLTAGLFADIGYTINFESTAIDAYSLPVDPIFVQIAPTEKTFTYPSEFLGLSGGTGAAEGTVQAIDLKIDESADPADPASNNPANSTSGCEPEDFAGFTAGNIALLQRGTCTFVQKVDNAKAAGAVGVIIFNQGNTPERKGSFGALSSGLPGVSVSFDLGVNLTTTEGLTVRIDQGTEESLLTIAAKKPDFQEFILPPTHTMSPTGKLTKLPQ